MDQTFTDASRESTALLTTLERRALHWIAVRLPSRIGSDHLTALGIVAMGGTGAAFWMAGHYRPALWAVPLLLALNWFGDSLDGTLARVRRQPRPRYGFYVDHMLDAVGALLLLAGLAASGFMAPAIAAGLLIAYYLLSIEVFLATYCLGTFRLSFWRVGPTELRILLAVGALALLAHPAVHVLGRTLRLFDVGGAIGAAGLAITALSAAVAHTRHLYRAEPLPPAATQPPSPGRPFPRRSLLNRWTAFSIVGAAGFAVQLAALGLLLQWHVHYLLAAGIAVLAAVAHNFWWHARWTWSDRTGANPDVWRRGLRFLLTNGVVSLAGNVALTGVLVASVEVAPGLAGAVAVAACAALNFLMAHVFVFREHRAVSGAS